MNEIAAKEREAKELELAFENQQLEQLKLEEDEFQNYAEQVIQQAQKADRNVFPLKVSPALIPTIISHDINNLLIMTSGGGGEGRGWR